jgi:hypothetical protein
MENNNNKISNQKCFLNLLENCVNDMISKVENMQDVPEEAKDRKNNTIIALKNLLNTFKSYENVFSKTEKLPDSLEVLFDGNGLRFKLGNLPDILKLHENENIKFKNLSKAPGIMIGANDSGFNMLNSLNVLKFQENKISESKNLQNK